MALADLIAGQRPPNILGNFTQGLATGAQLGQINDQRQRQSRLSGLLQQGAEPEQLVQEGFPSEAANILKVRSQMKVEERKAFDTSMQRTSALLEGINDTEDPNLIPQLQAGIEQNILDRDDAQRVLELGPRFVHSIAEKTKSGQTINIGNQQITPGRKKVDEKFAETIVDFKAAGGFADVQKSLTQLKEARDNLENKAVETGFMNSLIPESLKAAFAPDLLALKQSVEEVVQRNLRLVLGPQFTEKEGERLISRAFDEKLKTSENVKRIDRLINQIAIAAKAKQEAIEYFEQNGTLTGFKGAQYTKADFSPEKLFGEKKQNTDEATRSDPGEMSDEDLLKALNGG